MNPAGLPARHLPIGMVVKRSFAYAWESRAVLAVPFGIYALITVALGFLGELGGDTGAGSFVVQVAAVIVSMAFAVAVHRYVLLGDAHRGIRFFRWDRAVIVYFGTLMLLVLAATLLTVFAAGLVFELVSPNSAIQAGGGGKGAGFIAVPIILAVMAGLVALFRLSLAMPAAALSQGDRFALAWRASRGNGLRIGAAMILVWLPFLAVQGVLLYPYLLAVMQAVQAGAQAPDVPQPGMLIEVAWSALSSLQFAVSLVALSLCYDWLVRGGGHSGPVRITV